jgi:hypothetical protein
VFPEKLGGDDPRRPSSNRVAIWVVVTAVGLYFVVTGIIGIVTPG